MIIAKMQISICQDEMEKIKNYLQDAFPGERIVILSAYVDLQFVNFGKKRCTYCGRLSEGEEAKCAGCGSAL